MNIRDKAQALYHEAVHFDLEQVKAKTQQVIEAACKARRRYVTIHFAEGADTIAGWLESEGFSVNQLFSTVRITWVGGLSPYLDMTTDAGISTGGDLTHLHEDLMEYADELGYAPVTHDTIQDGYITPEKMASYTPSYTPCWGGATGEIFSGGVSVEDFPNKPSIWK